MSLAECRRLETAQFVPVPDQQFAEGEVLDLINPEAVALARVWELDEDEEDEDDDSRYKLTVWFIGGDDVPVEYSFDTKEKREIVIQRLREAVPCPNGSN